jgi:hypothetical protein
MIILKFDGNTGLSDFLNVTVVNPTAAGAIQWYCTWNTTPPTAPLPFDRNFGIAVIGPSINPMTPTLVAASPELDIREIAVHNTRQEPVGIAIEFSNGAAPTYRLYSCVLGAGHSLTYNAVPGVESSWKVFDGEGHLVSQ